MEKEKVDKSALGYDYKGQTEKHQSQRGEPGRPPASSQRFPDALPSAARLLQGLRREVWRGAGEGGQGGAGLRL